MHRVQFRETVEIVGVVSIVASLLLVAWEVRQSNRIAGTEVMLKLSEQFNEIHSDRVISPEFAKLYPKMASPENHLVTATENSQMEGLAWRYVNIYLSVQVAYDHGLISRRHFERIASGGAALVENYPGLHPHLVGVTAAIPETQSLEILQPFAELAARQQEESSETQ